MKKKNWLVCCLVVAMILILFVPVSAQAEAAVVRSGSSGNVKWVLYDDGLLSLTGRGTMSTYSSNGAPWYSYADQVKTLEVGEGITSIGAYAFKDLDQLTSVELPEGITKIDRYGFYGCERLVEIELPSTLKTIGEYAFAYCYSIENISFPDGLQSIDQAAFTMCGSLKEVVLPDTVTYLGGSAFAQCDDLERAVLSDGLTTLLSSAFFDSDALKEVVMPRNLKTIENTVFGSCDSLVSITIPDSVTSLAGSSLFACTSMQKILVEEGNTTYKSVDGVLFSVDGKELYCYPAGREGAYQIPEGTVTIKQNAFTECFGLTELKVADSVTTFEDSAVSRCDALLEIDLNNVQTMGENSLEGCTALKRVFFGKNLKSLGAEIFFRAINVSVNVDQIYFTGDPPAFVADRYGNETFRGTTGYGGTAVSAYTIYYPANNTKWASVVNSGNLYGANEGGLTWVPYDPDAVAEGDFGNGMHWSLDEDGTLTITGSGQMPAVTDVIPWHDVSYKVKKAVIGEGITAIGAYNFYECFNLEQVVIPETVTAIGDYAFYGCKGLKTQVLPDSLTTLGIGAFYNSGLTEIVLPDNCLTIGQGAFYLCADLAEVTLPADLTAIAPDCFASCPSLTSIEIPDKVTSIGSNAFYVTGLTEVTIPASVREIGTYVFSESMDLENIFVEDGNTALKDVDGVLFSRDGTILYNYPMARTGSYVIPEGVVNIPGGAFRGSQLSEVTFPTTLTSLGAGSFRRCHNLVKVDLTNTRVTSIGASAFRECNALKEFITGDSVTTISNYAFYASNHLETIVFGRNVAQIGDQLLTYTNHDRTLKQLYFTGSAPKIPSQAFYLLYGDVYYPAGDSSWNSVITNKYGSFGIKYHAHIYAHDHVYEPVEVAPTCTEQGYTKYVCSICGESYVDENSYVAALGHSYETVVFDPTCMDMGYTADVCARCGDMQIDDDSYVDTTDHDWCDWYLLYEPTCCDYGMEERYCNYCWNYEWREMEPVDHSWSEWYTIIEPTCCDYGMDERYCNYCWNYDWRETEPIDHSWSDWQLVTEPTCEDAGTEERYCLYCGAPEFQSISPLGHTEEPIPGKAATCTETGLTEGVKCAVCGEILIAQEVIPATGHAWTDWTVTKAATCTENGVETRICANCGETEARSIPAVGHTEETIPGKAATCTETGLTEGVKCAVCGEILVAQEIIPATGHAWNGWTATKAATCTENGVETRICNNCGETEARSIPAVGHTEETIPGKAATCTETGLTEGVKCSVCGEILVAQEIIPATGHAWSDWTVAEAATCTENGVETRVCANCGETEARSIPAVGHTEETIPGKAATCTETGLTEGVKCSVCGEILVAQEIIPATGHAWNGWTVTKAATCTENGVETRVCANCSETEARSIPATGHTEETIPGKAATCTETGLTEGVKCAVCGEILVAQEIIPATGHAWTDWTVTKAATCTENGVETRSCDLCGETEARSIPAVGHTEETIPGKAATCTETGLTEGVKCSVCGEILVAQEIIPATGHNYVDGICTHCGEKKVTVIKTGWSGATQWTLTDDGVLTVYGAGNMKNYGYTGGQPWLEYADRITSVVIENGVTAVGSGAFKNLTNLESVTLPDTGLARIGEAAFYGCTALKEIDIPDSVYTVFDYTFKNCTALSDVRLSKNLIKVGQGAFENCTSLDYVFIPGNVEIIGSWSFKGCTSLKTADMQWADATEIREGAFKNCSALTEIILPVNIQVLGDSCFYGIGVTSFVVPETVTSVEAWCFARAALQEITFLGDAPTIGEGAFNKITLTAYYPGDNATWTADLMQNYGGTVTWEAHE